MKKKDRDVIQSDGYRPLGPQDLSEYIAGNDMLCRRLGGTPESWLVSEVGDGNLNLVTLVRGPKSAIAVKQSLPYVRVVGEGWPLSTARTHYEHMALEIQGKHAPSLVPEVFHYDQELALIVMEALEPHIIMRRGLIDGIAYPHFTEAITTFLASTLFHTSDLALAADEKKRMSAAFAHNYAMSKLIEDLVFTEPFMAAANNRWTAGLDDTVARLQGDGAAKSAACRLKLKFLSSQEALIHADLHTGSIMVSSDDLRVIDAEFAFVGPMGYDLGALIGNLLMNYFAQPGLESEANSRIGQETWILSTVETCWVEFRRKFLRLWRQHGDGDAYPVALFAGETDHPALERERAGYLDRLYQDMLGFAALEIIRRIVGLAHNADLELIEDAARRAEIEARLLSLARVLLVEPQRFGAIEHLVGECQRRHAGLRTRA